MLNSANNQPKIETYSIIKQELQALLSGENNFISILANTSALIYNKLENINWAGFYLLYKNTLKLGPFQGKVACQNIPLGKGVCGNAAIAKKTLLVENVHAFNGHITCDINTNSEIVLPLIIQEQVIGVLDIDSPILARFNSKDQQGLQEIVNVLCEKLSYTNIVSFLQDN